MQAQPAMHGGLQLVVQVVHAKMKALATLTISEVQQVSQSIAGSMDACH